MTNKWVLVMASCLLAGCATSSSGPRLSSLGREVNVSPLRGQVAAQVTVDDRECEAWTRQTKGDTEPLPSANLRYGVCMIARGYEAAMGTLNLSIPRVSHAQSLPLADHVALMQACRADKLNPGSFDIPFGGQGVVREKTITCLAQRGYTIRHQDYPKR